MPDLQHTQQLLFTFWPFSAHLFHYKMWVFYKWLKTSSPRSPDTVASWCAPRISSTRTTYSIWLSLGTKPTQLGLGEHLWRLVKFRHINYLVRFRKTLVTFGFAGDTNPSFLGGSRVWDSIPRPLGTLWLCKPHHVVQFLWSSHTEADVFTMEVHGGNDNRCFTRLFFMVILFIFVLLIG